jgi:hypothetical protein
MNPSSSGPELLPIGADGVNGSQICYAFGDRAARGDRSLSIQRANSTPKVVLPSPPWIFTGVELFAIEDVVSVFFDLIGLLTPKFFVPFVGVLTSGRIFQNFSASSRVTRAR